MVDDSSRPINLDLYLAEHIARRLEEFRVHSLGHPSNYTEESWNAKLRGIITKLNVYSTKFDTDTLDKELEVTRAGQEAMREIADIFPNLWD